MLAQSTSHQKQVLLRFILVTSWTEQVGSRDKSSTYIWRVLGLSLSWDTAVFTEVLCNFPQHFQTYSEIVTKIRTRPRLPNPFQFIVHYHPIIWRYKFWTTHSIIKYIRGTMNLFLQTCLFIGSFLTKISFSHIFLLSVPHKSPLSRLSSFNSLKILNKTQC